MEKEKITSTNQIIEKEDFEPFVFKQKEVQRKYIKTESPTKVFALGGLEEIGKNTYCIEHENEIIMIDAGVKFPDDSMLGINAVIPDYSYLKENESKIKALFITHGHEDHIGGIHYLVKQVNIPVIYAPELAAALIRDRLKEHKLTDKTIVKEYVADDIWATKNLRVSYAALNHSIPDAFGILVETPNGNIFSTGDYKFDWSPLGHFAELSKLASMGDKGIELLMSDSTNAEVEGYTPGEKGIIENIDKLFLKAKGRIFITTFASNVHRIQQIVELANKYDKKVVILGRSIERIIKIIRQMGHLKINDKMFIKANDIDKHPANKIMIISTGSQGEPMAALSRIATNRHQSISIIPGDTVIFSSSPIPGNRADVEILINRLTRIGANVIESSPSNRIHTSGHASQEEQKLLFTLLRPNYFMPMHGEFRMLKKHIETAESVNLQKGHGFVMANGDQLELLQGNAQIGKRVDADAIYVDGKDMTAHASNIIRERDILSKDGLISVVVSIDSQTNKLLCAPRIISRGSFYVKDSGNVISEAITIVTEAINEVLNSNKPTFGAIKKAIKQSLSPYIFKTKRRNPLIIPVILNKK
ncbi:MULTISPECIES: ribonuclease J [Mesoplasma]|uniref:Ribonuclease J n=2 Tax=Mesoplasma florum TaxID=2151 RepID=Q6F0P5_MESFL|nr:MULTISPECIES: ribonuclease J [Mesoplasma]AAT75928.1 putative metallo-beta lactamase hydrolase [Mesoplasma florum L1]AGY41684.1 Ribonuclease J1 (endonuclease and 5' exonuclease) [Mesoplasma florum W37]ATI73534.1 RNase J family beta-CASP ribonuclease [Mesoplasma florum]ATI74223.1 RNase J family beta-CASP ribonuclease [Mesoplasma florum]AVN59888.1 RNase J family beta-CASP ribonuclease [Mesoplasma florum]